MIFIYSKRNQYFHVASAVNGDENYYYNSAFPPILNTWTEVIIQQHYSSSDALMYEISINGTVVHSIENTDGRLFSNVEVYASDRWHVSQKGELRNLDITFNEGR